MILRRSISIWWGPPKEFKTDPGERRVSWLELFYDLVYVIAIARITGHFAHHVDLHHFLEYACLFALIFWGWLNGSFHHDLHGGQGLRTRLMTLWQMVIIASLAVLLDKPSFDLKSVTIVFMLMQIFITYQWWSVGVYDKGHRRYSWPYTSFFLLSLALMGISLFIPHTWLAVLIPLVLLCNYLPPFLSHRLLRRSSLNLNLSSSMFERLGLFTIIIFGELALGLVHGAGKIAILRATDWLNFTLGFAIVFALWWIFFTFVSNREVKRGFHKASLLELLYIPALIALGCIAVSLSSFFDGSGNGHNLEQLFEISVAVFLICILLMMFLLAYPAVFRTLMRPMRISLLVTACLFIVLAGFSSHLSTTTYFALILTLLSIEIAHLNFVYYSQLLKEGINPEDVVIEREVDL